jgi:hypothetical protein
LTGVGWVFAFFIVGTTILAGRWLLGLGLAKFNREVPGELDGKATSAGVVAPVISDETKALFDRADELLKQGTQSEDNRALIEAVATYRRGLALLARPESPLQWALAHTNLAVALEILGERENGTARIEEAFEVYREALKKRSAIDRIESAELRQLVETAASAPDRCDVITKPPRELSKLCVARVRTNAKYFSGRPMVRLRLDRIAGYFAYHAVPTNGLALSAFRHHVKILWPKNISASSSAGQPRLNSYAAARRRSSLAPALL